MERIKKLILLGLSLTEREKATFALFIENETFAEWTYTVLNIG